MTQEPSKGNEDLKRWLNLSIFILGLTKNGKSCKDVVRQKGVS